MVFIKITQNKGLNFFREQQQPHQQQSPPKSSYLTLDDFLGSCFPAPAHSMQEIKRLESIAENSEETLYTPALSSSLQLLRKCGSGKEIECNQLGGASDETCFSTRKKLSTEEIIRVAGSRFIQFSDQRCDDFSMLMHPFGYALSGLSEEETRDVELTRLLLATAEEVGYQQFDRASRLLSRCEGVASERSNPLQRVVYYFAEALQGRIHKATGRFIPKEMKGKPNCETPHGLSTHLGHLSMHQNVPFNQVMQLTAIQAIIENVGSARKIHLIDLEIRSGVQWTALMQALADRQRRLDHLKITAVGLRGIQKIEETGKRLEIFARSMNFPFTFKPVKVSCMSEIKEELFETAADEAIVVVANMILRTMLSRPACLENLMRVIKNLNPSIMIVGEVEANHNSPTFVNRFVEALFFYGAYFDCLETCLKQNTEHRTITEATFSNGIENIVTMEGTDRIARSVKMDVWRAFFSRFRMVEVGFSDSSLYQAGLIPKQFPCGSSCTLEKNGECLIVGWKGTPLHSLSAWKFSRERLWRSLANYNF